MNADPAMKAAEEPVENLHTIIPKSAKVRESSLSACARNFDRIDRSRPDKPLLEGIIECLQDSNYQIRAHAARILGRNTATGSLRGDESSKLAALLRDPYHTVQRDALQSLKLCQLCDKYAGEILDLLDRRDLSLQDQLAALEALRQVPNT